MADRQNDRYRRLLNQESLILEATELICELMQRQGISRRELASRIGRTREFVGQLLNGSRNMILRTLADLTYALDHRIQLRAVPLAPVTDRTVPVDAPSPSSAPCDEVRGDGPVPVRAQHCTGPGA
ncbi:MAG TPA: helix-turn-helix transcriptional regulator [Candidatus Dormibacteraeota bacterium]|nr:helix-turn-helix transcriptional regulator [Candidatus Dormibacteraeota bacterium]